MTHTTRVHAGTAAGLRRKLRPRAVPRWLQTRKDLDAIARRRMLLLLSVLSGELPVTTAITQAKISRPTYYKLETRALNAMLAALNPRAGAAFARPDLSAATARIAQLEQKAAELERDKRRAERLLLLARKAMRAPVASPWRAQPPRRPRPATTPGAPPRVTGSAH